MSMTTHTLVKGRRARGYLLIEVMMSGAILAVILGAAITVVGDERAAITRATHRANAAALAEELLQAIMADTGTTKTYTSDGTWVQDDPDQTKFPGFTRRYNVDSVATANTSALGELFSVQVEVTHPSGPGGAVGTVTHSALRRDRLMGQ